MCQPASTCTTGRTRDPALRRHPPMSVRADTHRGPRTWTGGVRRRRPPGIHGQTRRVWLAVPSCQRPHGGSMLDSDVDRLAVARSTMLRLRTNRMYSTAQPLADHMVGRGNAMAAAAVVGATHCPGGDGHDNQRPTAPASPPRHRRRAGGRQPAWMRAVERQMSGRRPHRHSDAAIDRPWADAKKEREHTRTLKSECG